MADTDGGGFLATAIECWLEAARENRRSCSQRGADIQISIGTSNSRSLHGRKASFASSTMRKVAAMPTEIERAFEECGDFVAALIVVASINDDAVAAAREVLDLEHDPEKCAAVFPRDKRDAFARRSCSIKNLERDDDSTSSLRALAARTSIAASCAARPTRCAGLACSMSPTSSPRPPSSPSGRR